MRKGAGRRGKEGRRVKENNFNTRLRQKERSSVYPTQLTYRCGVAGAVHPDSTTVGPAVPHKGGVGDIDTALWEDITGV